VRGCPLWPKAGEGHFLVRRPGHGVPQRITESKARRRRLGGGGYAATWDRDLGDVIHPGAFTTSLAAGHKVRFLYAHDPAQPARAPRSS
jgi:phage head maturation protease